VLLLFIQQVKLIVILLIEPVKQQPVKLLVVLVIEQLLVLFVKPPQIRHRRRVPRRQPPRPL